MGYFGGQGEVKKTVLGSTHVSKQISFSMFPSILTLDYSLNLGSFLTFWGYNGFFGVRVGFKNCFGVSLYRLITFVISVWLYKSYIGSELKSKVSRWTAGQPDGYVKIMPLVAPTPQLRLRWTELSWSVGAECGKKKCEVRSNFQRT